MIEPAVGKWWKSGTLQHPMKVTRSTCDLHTRLELCTMIPKFNWYSQTLRCGVVNAWKMRSDYASKENFYCHPQEIKTQEYWFISRAHSLLCNDREVCFLVKYSYGEPEPLQWNLSLPNIVGLPNSAKVRDGILEFVFQCFPLTVTGIVRIFCLVIPKRA